MEKEDNQTVIFKQEPKVTILKTRLVGKGSTLFLAGNANGQIATLTPREIDILKRNNIPITTEVVEKEIAPNVMALNVVKEGKEQFAINVVHIVDFNCAVAYNPQTGTWITDKNVTYSRKQIKEAKKEQDRAQKAAKRENGKTVNANNQGHVQ